MSTARHQILVTGGTGFVGQTLVRRLVASGNEVRVLTRNPQGQRAAELLDAVEDPSCVDLRGVDIGGELDSLLPEFDGVSQVFHVAGLTNSIAPYSTFERANVTATRNVCEAALRMTVRKLVHVSTCDVFGVPRTGEVITEKTPYRNWGEAYPDSKIKAAEIVRAYQGQGLCSTLVYPGWVYGPGDRAFIPSLANQLTDGYMAFWCRGGFEVYFVYIEDLVDVLLSAMESPAADNDDYLILDDNSGITLQDFCQVIAEHLGVRFLSLHLPYFLMAGVGWASESICRSGLTDAPLLSRLDAKYFGHRFRFSCAKAREELGWERRTSYETGFREALNWYERNLKGERVLKN